MPEPYDVNLGLLAALKTAYDMIQEMQPVVLGLSDQAHKDRCRRAEIRFAIEKAEEAQCHT